MRNNRASRRKQEAERFQAAVAKTAQQLLTDPATVRGFWKRSLTDRDMLLDLAEMVRSDPKAQVAMLALFPGGVPCNAVLWELHDQGCWSLTPEPERNTISGDGRRAPYAHETVDLHLDPRIFFRPSRDKVHLANSGEVVERIRNWPSRVLNDDPDDPINVIDPLQSFVCFTDASLKLPLDCIVPLTGNVVTKSSQARDANFLSPPGALKIRNGHNGPVCAEPTNLGSDPIVLKPHMPILAFWLEPVVGRAVRCNSLYHDGNGSVH